MTSSKPPTPNAPAPRPTLRRSVTLPFLVFYGLGTIVGGGFYALLGEVVAIAGMATPLAFLLTGALALLSAFSFADLSARYPVSAGEARFVEAGFNSRRLSQTTGFLVMATGVVSAATLAVATAQFVAPLLPQALPFGSFIIITLLFAGMFSIAAWGIGGSVWVITLITVIEVGALAYVFAINAGALADLPARAAEIFPAPGQITDPYLLGIFGAAFLAFYAFIGFEDMVNIAEEVKDPRRNMPRAIFIAIGLASLLYVLVALVAVLAVPIDQIAKSAAPITALAQGQGTFSTTSLWLVSILAGLNGALVQLIMAARVSYGMAGRGMAPRWMADIHATRHTPLKATVLVVLISWGLASFLPLATLAQITSSIVLAIFAMVNLALWRIKGREATAPPEALSLPRVVPLIGFTISAGVLAFNIALKLGVLV